MLLPGGRIDEHSRGGVNHKEKVVSVRSLPMQDRLWLSYRYLAIHEVCACSHDEKHFECHLKDELVRTSRPLDAEHPEERKRFRVTSTCCKTCKKCELPVRMDAHENHEKHCALLVDMGLLKCPPGPIKKVESSTWRAD